MADPSLTIVDLALRRGLVTPEQARDCPTADMLVARGLLSHGDLQRLADDLRALTAQTMKAAARALSQESLRDAPTAVRAAAGLPGTQFGRYVLVEKIGEGGMGMIWRAWQTDLGRWVALKFVKGDDPGDVARFVREAQLAAKLSHPNIIATHEAGQHDGSHYISMELVDGDDLKRRRVAPRQAVELIRDAAGAVDYAHRQGIVHRDLKPQNLLLSETGRVYVTDFGLARSLKAPSGMTASGMIVGTPQYMAPEQVRLERVDGRADVYALGATLYELVTGHPPFESDNLIDLLGMVASAEPSPPRRLNPKLPRDVETIVLKALEKNPERRYATAQALADDLGRHLRGEPIEARPASLLYKAALVVRRNALASAAVALLAGTLATLAVIWLRTPGRLSFHVKPEGALVTIDDQAWRVGADTPPTELGAGVYRALIDAPDHDPEERTVEIRRGQTENLTVELKHHVGWIEVDCKPGGEIAVDGTSFGTLLRNHEVETGRHRLTAWADGYFEREGGVTVVRGQTASSFLWLDRGEIWRLRNSAITSTAIERLVRDHDGDGVPDIVFSELEQLVICSGASSRELWRSEPLLAGLTHIRHVDLGGATGRVMLCGSDMKEGARLVCVDLSAPDDRKILWIWEGPPRRWEVPQTVGFSLAEDLTGDGTREIVACDREGSSWIVDGRRGTTVRGPLPMEQKWNGRGVVAGNLYLFAGKTSSGGWTIGCVNILDGTPVWTRSFDEAISSGLYDLDGDAMPEFLSLSPDAWEVVDGRSGSTRARQPFRQRADVATAPLSVDIDGDGVSELFFFFSNGQAEAWSLDGPRLLWTRSIGLAADRAMSWAAGMARAPGGELLVPTADALLAIDPTDGSTRWTVDGKPYGWRLLDIDGDGRVEIVAGVVGRGLVCVEPDGRVRWRMRLDADVAPSLVMPDADGDGLDEILAHGTNFGLILVRQPRVLWSRQAPTALRAAPVVFDADGDGRPEVAQMAQWVMDGSAACFDGGTGAGRWKSPVRGSDNRPPVALDWDGDGRQELAMFGRDPKGTQDSAYLIRGGDGLPLTSVAVDATDRYATPAVADFTGDGRADMAIHQWLHHDVIAVDPAAGRELWRFETEGTNMGGLGAADLDDDGLADVVAPSMDGHVYALRGLDGTLLWKAPIGPGGSRSPPALADLTGDGVKDALVNASHTGLWVLDGRTGSELAHWTAEAAATEGLGRPVVTTVQGHGLVIVAAFDAAGVAAFEWSTREVLWRAPFRVQSGPIVADLDGDGVDELVLTCRDGELRVLDLAAGDLLWHLKVDDADIEADPAVADLDGDGVLDILVATHGGTLSAISGRGTIGARRRQSF